MNRIALAALAAAIFVLAGTSPAQQAPPAAPPAIDFTKVEIKTTDLGHGAYMMEGAGGNMTLATASDGAILVDGEYAPLHDKIKAAIAAVTKEPVRYLVNTHFHGDHTGGNEGFAKDGATVVAHENVKTRLAAGTTNGLSGAKTPPAPEAALPTKTYKDKMSLKLKGRSADLGHVAAAHTDGDTYVYLKDANVLATGDTFTNGRYPNIDFANGGNVKGMIASADLYLKIANDETKIVPGHGSLATKADLKQYRAMLATARDRVAKLIKDGKSIDEAVAAKPMAETDAKFGANEQAAGNFIRVVYRSLKPA